MWRKLTSIKNYREEREAEEERQDEETVKSMVGGTDPGVADKGKGRAEPEPEIEIEMEGRDEE